MIYSHVIVSNTNYIFRQLSPKCQMLFFSATYDKEVMEFAEHIVPEANIIRYTKTLK